MNKPVVVIAETLSDATVGALGPDFEIVTVDGTDRAALLEAVAGASALLVRSATQVDRALFANAPNLSVVARAGVGLDNVDIAAATEAGVMVVNAPTSNIISAAELAIAHLLSLARHLPAADASMKAGKWQRSAFTGVELYDKTVGIVGLGRIGALVAARLAPFDVHLIGYDPYISPARAEQLGVAVVSLDELMQRSDFITIHIPKTPDTVGLIGEEQFARAKPNLRIVNCSRGGIIDELALNAALASGLIAGAALDVYVHEPPTGSPLLQRPEIELTPHLGASTDEAQEKAGVAVARSVRAALGGELVADAVNVAGGAVDPYVRPGLPLVEKLAQVFGALAPEPLETVDVEVDGELVQYNVAVLRLAALKGLLTNVVSEHVSYVNAPVIAEQRGLSARLVTDPSTRDYRNVITIRGRFSGGRELSVSGTLTGPHQIEKLVGINGFTFEVPISEHLVVMQYRDRPGIVAIYGSEFGERGINIAGMQIAQNTVSGTALSVISVDSSVPPDVIERLRTAIDAEVMRSVDLVL